MPKVVPEYREQARKRILDAAIAEFVSKGYRKTTMSDIADRVGVSKAAVYQYYENKEALVGAVAVTSAEKLLACMIASERGRSITQTTKEAFEQAMTAMPEWFPNLLCDFLSKAYRDKSARQQVRELERKLVKAISELWEEQKNAGEVSKDVDTEGIARGLVALFVGLLALVSVGMPRSEAVSAWKGIVAEMTSGSGHKRPSSR